MIPPGHTRWEVLHVLTGRSRRECPSATTGRVGVGRVDLFCLNLGPDFTSYRESPVTLVRFSDPSTPIGPYQGFRRSLVLISVGTSRSPCSVGPPPEVSDPNQNRIWDVQGRADWRETIRGCPTDSETNRNRVKWEFHYDGMMSIPLTQGLSDLLGPNRSPGPRLDPYLGPDGLRLRVGEVTERGTTGTSPKDEVRLLRDSRSVEWSWVPSHTWTEKTTEVYSTGKE